MATTHPIGTGHPGLSSPDRGPSTTRSASEGTAAGLLVVIGAAVVGIGVVVHMLGRRRACTHRRARHAGAPAGGRAPGGDRHDRRRPRPRPGRRLRLVAYGLLGLAAVVACVVAVAVGLQHLTATGRPAWHDRAGRSEGGERCRWGWSVGSGRGAAAGTA